MFDIPFYIAEEYFYKNRIYKGKYPISIVDSPCQTPVFVPRTELIEELDEDDIIKLKMEESTDKNPKYILTQTDKPKVQKTLDGGSISIYPII
jgi:hypothetical protein